jgi:hypothetical protein
LANPDTTCVATTTKLTLTSHLSYLFNSNATEFV